MSFDEPCISIPVQESDELVVVPTSELPAEPEDLLELLKGELAPLHLWLDFAKAYLAKGQVDAFLHILDVATGPEVEQYFAESKFERLQIHCAMSAYHLNRAQKLKDRSAKTDALAQATAGLNKAITIDVNEQLPVLGLGQVALAKGDVAHAKNLFEKASRLTSNGRKNISGLLSLASLTFQQEQYREALQLYCRALKEHPNCPYEVRLGIAACNFRLGSFQKAKAAYERTLQLAPACCEALLGLAVLSFNAPDAARGLREGLQMLCRAYNSDPLHPGVLNLLAHFSLLSGDLEKARSLASTAFEAAQTDHARAQSMTTLARASHSAGAVQDAFRYYGQATALNPKAALPLLGLAQMELLQKENTNAITFLEKALQFAPGWNDALMVLGNLYPQMEGRKGQSAVDHFKNAAAKNTSSGDVLEMLGELLATTNPAESLAAYKKSMVLYRKEKQAMKAAKAKAKHHATANSRLPNGGGLQAVAASEGALEMDKVGDEAQQSQTASDLAVKAAIEGGHEERVNEANESQDDHLPTKLLNNAAALHLRGGEKVAALQLMYEAVEAGNRPGSNLAASNKVTLGYNLARAKEANANLTEATREYKEILAEFPEYVDCYFRLAWIARAKGNHAEALHWAERALEVKAKDPDALALIGFLHLEKREWKEAEDTFKELRQEPGNKNDAYAVMAQGAIPLNSLSANRKKEDPNRVDRLLKIALDHFRMVMDRDEHNLYAAHGIAAVLAEQATRVEPPKAEFLVHAKKVFDRVKDAAASVDPWIQLPDLTENLGHIALAEGRSKDAIQFYNNVQRRHSRGTSSEMLLYCARALYDEDGRRTAAGTAEKTSLLPEARKCLLKAIHLDPSNYSLQFNAAFVMQEWAVRVLKKVRPERDPSKAQEFASAVLDLAMAHRTFFYLRNLGKRSIRVGVEDQKLESHILFCHNTHAKASQLAKQAEKEAAALEAKRQQSRIELEAALRERAAKEEAAKRREERKAAEREEKARQAQQRLQELQAAWADTKAVTEAAAEGDAMKADKKRKKKKREDEVDAIFGGSDSDDGGDYDPNAPEEVEYITGDPEENGKDEAQRKKDALAGTGLDSDEEMEDSDEGGSQGDDARLRSRGNAEEPKSIRGRLKRHRLGEASEAPVTNLDHIFGDSDGEAGNETGAVAEERQKSPQLKRRNVDLFGDSDEE